MSAYLYSATTYADLEEAFTERLRELQDTGVGPIWAVTPTNLAALHLRRRAAEDLGGVAGVRFLTMRDAARRMLRRRLAEQRLSPAPPGAASLVVQDILEEVPDDSYFAAFREFHNAAPALLRGIHLLTACRWTPEAFREAADKAAFEDKAAPRRLRELADLWVDLRNWKQEHRLYEDEDLISAAGEEEAPPTEHPAALLVYGFYDFTPAQRALLSRLIERARSRDAFLLWREDDGRAAPGFEYARPVVEWLRAQLGLHLVEKDGGEPSGDLSRLVSELFAEHRAISAEEAEARLADSGAEWDGSVRVLNCPGRPAEAEEIVRDCLDRASQGDACGQIGVLMRGAGSAEALTEVFQRSDVKCYVREGLPLAETLAGRVAMALLELAAGDADRTRVVEFLALARVRWPEDLTATALDRVSRLAGVIGGRNQWPERLRERAGDLLERAERAEKEEEQRALRREAQLSTAAAGFLRDFFRRIEPLARPGDASWCETARTLCELVRDYTPEQTAGRARVLEMAEQLGALDVTGRSPRPDAVRWLLGRRLSRASRRMEHFQRVRVTLSSIMAARGTSFDVVVVPGLAEKNFPRRIGESPLITELDRKALNEAADRFGAGRLPVASDRPAEERYLFRVAAGSARQALVLTYPRLERGTDRPRVASRFLTEACAALVGFSVHPENVRQGLPAGLVERVPLQRKAWTGEGARPALDPWEYDAAVFRGAEGQRLRTGYLSALSPHFARALKLERQRWGRRDFGSWDGKVRRPERLHELQRADPAETSISPSRLETYAECPFRYFMKYVLEVEELEAPPEEFQLPPLERGLIVHEALSRLYREELEGLKLGRLSDGELEQLLARAGDLLDELGRVHAENHPATWRAERENTIEEVGALLEHERAEHAEARPFLFEHRLAGYALELEDGTRLRFRGRIDRVDRLPDGGVQVVDYKTGSSSRYREDALRGGRQLQLPIYLLAGCREAGAEAGRALYLFTAGPKDVREFDLQGLRERSDDLRQAVGLILDGIRSGNFFPLPADPYDAYGSYCRRYCPHRIACGAARGKLAEMKQSDPATADLQTLREIE